jgi:polar amino acid transport system substrate-binding protein
MGQFNYARTGLVLGWLGVQFVAPLSASAADLKTIRSRGYLIVAVKDNVRPLGFRNQQGELQGFEIDLAKRLAEQILGKPDAVKLLPVSNRDRLKAVMNDQVDLAIAEITATQARSRVVYFSSPYYFNGTSFLVQRRSSNNPSVSAPVDAPSYNPIQGNDSITELRQLRDQKVAVLENSQTIATLEFQASNLQLVPVKSYAEAQERLAQGEVAAIAANTTTLVGWAQANPDYQVIPAQLNREPLAVAFPKGLQYEDLGQVVMQSLRQWQTDGWLAERATYWGLPWDRLGSK